MDFSVIAPRTCVLKVYIHCQGCEKQVRKVLKKIAGVSSVKIDGESDKVTVSGVMDPNTVLKALAKDGKMAEILYDSNVSTNVHPSNHNHGIHQARTASRPHGFHPEQLHHLSNNERLKQFEWDHPYEKYAKYTDNFVADDHMQRWAGHNHFGGIHGGGTSQNCYCQGHIMNNIDYYGGCGPTPPMVGCGGCSAPPLPLPHGPNYLPRGPPPSAPPLPWSYSRPGVFSDENPNGCRVM